MTLFVATFSTLLAIINTLETGPGEIATVLGMISLIEQAEFEVAALVAISVALLAAMLVTYMVLRVVRIGAGADRSARNSRGNGDGLSWGH
jgi:hypothetical protein